MLFFSGFEFWWITWWWEFGGGGEGRDKKIREKKTLSSNPVRETIFRSVLTIRLHWLIDWLIDWYAFCKGKCWGVGLPGARHNSSDFLKITKQKHLKMYYGIDLCFYLAGTPGWFNSGFLVLLRRFLMIWEKEWKIGSNMHVFFSVFLILLT